MLCFYPNWLNNCWEKPHTFCSHICGAVCLHCAVCTINTVKQYELLEMCLSIGWANALMLPCDWHSMFRAMGWVTWLSESVFINHQILWSAFNFTQPFSTYCCCTNINQSRCAWRCPQSETISNLLENMLMADVVLSCSCQTCVTIIAVTYFLITKTKSQRNQWCPQDAANKHQMMHFILTDNIFLEIMTATL